jgi:hypothetical protein
MLYMNKEAGNSNGRYGGDQSSVIGAESARMLENSGSANAVH